MGPVILLSWLQGQLSCLLSMTRGERRRLSLAGVTATQIRSGTSSPHAHTLRASSPENLPPGFAPLCCPGEMQGLLSRGPQLVGEEEGQLSCSYESKASSPPYCRWRGARGRRDLSLVYATTREMNVKASSPTTPTMCGAFTVECCSCIGVRSALLFPWSQGQLYHNTQVKGGANSAQPLDINIP